MRKVKALGVAVATTLWRRVTTTQWRRVALTLRRRVAPTRRRRALHKVQLLITTSATVVKLQHTYKTKFTFSTMSSKRMVGNNTTLHLAFHSKIT